MMIATSLPTRAFYFVRHGQTQYNLERRFQGSIDVSLNENGVLQAKEAARLLSNHRYTRIISSPAKRVLQTAHIIAEADSTAIRHEKDLMEFNVGSLEGQRIDAVMQAHGKQAQESFMSILPDDADNWHEFAPRVCAAVKYWTDHYATETLLIAAHGLVFRALTESLQGKTAMSRNGEPFYFKTNGDTWDVTSIQETGLISI